MNKNVKRGLMVAGALTTVAAGATYVAIAERVFKDFFIQKKEGFDLGVNIDEYQSILDWYNSSNVYETWIKSNDGLNLHGKRIINHPESNQWVILLHPLGMDLTKMLKATMKFDELGYNCLLVDGRGHGQSEGKYTTLGWYEQFDLLTWINDLVASYPKVNIVLYGLSYGAVTIMMASSNIVCDNVKVCIIDSGFTSLRDLMVEEVNRNLKFGGKLFLPYLKLIIKNRLKFDMNQLDVRHSLANNYIPMLFIHSEYDSIVHVDYAYENYYANNSLKEIITYKNNDHLSCLNNEDYFDKVMKFIKRHS
ncbi:alpha/beta hydrolase [Erysipelotrichaceae bacterium OH741_COT-311]|nr:alpha/beta hydrolase [Erysipelotrichaceae bacterium OH741_COT-311]